MPKLTVTIPTYNRAHLIGATVRSVLEQSFSDFELFVSDNASTDDTAEVIAAFRDPRITYLRSDENRGHFWNLSRGLHLGGAPYVAILPDDDSMLPGNLEKKIALLESNPEVGIVHSGYKRVLRDKVGRESEVDVYTDGKVDGVVAGPEMVRRILRGQSAIEYSTAIFRRDIIASDEGFAPEDKGADDVALSLRMAARAGMVAYLAEPLASIVLHEAAGNRIAGGFERVGDDFVATIRSVCDVRDAKLRFLARSGVATGADAGAVRDVRDVAQQDLIGITRLHIGAWEPARDVAAFFVEAVRADPGLLKQRDFAGLVLASMRGARARVAARGVRFQRWARGRPPVGLVRFGSLRRVAPINPKWFGRGKSIDRYYIAQFLRAHAEDVRGRVLEIGDRNYTTKLAQRDILSSDVLDVVATPSTTIVADLGDPDLDIGTFDCVLCVQTVQLIFDTETVFKNLRRMVAPGGTLFVTAHGMAQLDESEHWDDVWRFSPSAFRRLLEAEFGEGNVEVESFGNVLAAIAFLHGLSEPELRPRELDVRDPRYPVIVAARAVVPPE